jgi:4-azaleucine resistance transporter AzlC
VLAESAGIDGVASVVMSATTFAGSSQFAAASVLSGGGSAAAAIAAALMLNLRYGAMGAVAAPAIRGGRLRRLLEAQLVVDESWALSNRRGRFERGMLMGVGMVLYLSWVAGTAAGVLAGDALGDPESLGLDAAFPALFLLLLTSQIESRVQTVAALLGAAIALALVPVAPAGVPVLAGAAAALIGLGRRSER